MNSRWTSNHLLQMSGFGNQAKQSGMRVLEVRSASIQRYRQGDRETDRQAEAVTQSQTQTERSGSSSSSGTQGRERLTGQGTHLGFTQGGLSGGHL